MKVRDLVIADEKALALKPLLELRRKETKWAQVSSGGCGGRLIAERNPGNGNRTLH